MKVLKSIETNWSYRQLATSLQVVQTAAAGANDGEKDELTRQGVPNIAAAGANDGETDELTRQGVPNIAAVEANDGETDELIRQRVPIIAYSIQYESRSNGERDIMRGCFNCKETDQRRLQMTKAV